MFGESPRVELVCELRLAVANPVAAKMRDVCLGRLELVEHDAALGMQSITQ